MKITYDAATITFERFCDADSCNIEWVADVLRHTMVDSLICITDIVETSTVPSAVLKDLVAFCDSNEGSVILIQVKFDDEKLRRGQSLSPDAESARRNDVIVRLANQSAIYSIMGFEDVSSWIDWAETKVFLYGNSQYVDFIDRLSAMQAGMYLASLSECGEGAKIIAREIADDPKARAILKDILDGRFSGDDKDAGGKMQSF